jgi:hypothetical protein
LATTHQEQPDACDIQHTAYRVNPWESGNGGVSAFLYTSIPVRSIVQAYLQTSTTLRPTLADHFYPSPPSWRTSKILLLDIVYPNPTLANTNHFLPHIQNRARHTHRTKTRCNCISMSSSLFRVWTMSLIHVDPANSQNHFQMKVGEAPSYFEQRRLWEEDLRRFVVGVCAPRSQRVARS